MSTKHTVTIMFASLALNAACGSGATQQVVTPASRPDATAANPQGAPDSVGTEVPVTGTADADGSPNGQDTWPQSTTAPQLSAGSRLATTTSAPTTDITTTAPAPTTVTPGPVASYDLTGSQVTVGYSVRGNEILAERSGTLGGRRILVIGVIHGNEDAGTKIVDQLRNAQVPDGNELWLINAMNPDGLADLDRHNANQVDLNRNFPYGWEPLGEPGDGQYSGPGPASEPETQAMVAFIETLQPDIVIWYHQDLNVIAPAEGRDGEIRAKYAELTGLPMESFSTPGARYTGIAATWARKTLAPIGTVAFIVELGPTLSAEQATTHANAILTIAREY